MSKTAAINDKDDVELEIVRELGFNNLLRGGGPRKEEVFFMGPCHCQRQIGEHATEEALRNFIAYFENQIQVARDYLANGRNNKTNEWATSEDNQSGHRS